MSLVNVVQEMNQQTISRDNGHAFSNGVNDKFALFILENCNCGLEVQQSRLTHASCFELSDVVREKIDIALQQINMELSNSKGVQMETTRTR